MISKINYLDGLLRDAAIALTVPRGGFYPDKNFGSAIKYTCLLYTSDAADEL